MAKPGEGAKLLVNRDESPQVSSNDVSEQLHESAHTVRFASHVDNVDDDQPLRLRNDSSATPEQIQALTNCLHGTQLQGRRARNYSFQPFSLPPSRVPSTDTTPGATPQHSHSPRAPRSPHFGPSSSGLTPPLTPAYTPAEQGNNGGTRQFGSESGSLQSEVTPQGSGHCSRPSSRLGLPHRPASSDNLSQKSTFTEDLSSPRLHRKGIFGLGTGGQSLPVSRESSPSRNPASQFYTRPFSPSGDANDPYAASKRPIQNKNVGQIDQRFVFPRKKKQASSLSSLNLRQSDKPDKRSSSLLGKGNKKDESTTGTNAGGHNHQSSMSDLRRFFKVGASQKLKRLSQTPHSASSVSSDSRSTHFPFGDDHGLSSKYGKIGRVLGSGAGGSVKLMRRNDDNTVFAVKEFRPRNPYETEKEYTKKLTAEFCFGSALHHGNIIETLDIVQEKGKWYEVMEYAPYDLFAIVMTGKMSKTEINCCFLQILSGVTYLHASGLAHRDLKLDNVVVGEHGIMKIIDFGSAHVFKYPFESEMVLASGIVGSDPYLAPEVYEERKYDAQAVDIWSLAIIFCCMSLRRFPWKLPRLSDNSYKLFAAQPTPGYNPDSLIHPSRLSNNLTDLPSQDIVSDEPPKSPKHSSPDEAPATNADNAERKEVIRGPWRLLRLLPRESRYIMYRMLTIDPKKRATMAEILDEPWVSDTVICRQIGPGQIEKGDHTHVLEPPALAPK